MNSSDGGPAQPAGGVSRAQRSLPHAADAGEHRRRTWSWPPATSSRGSPTTASSTTTSCAASSARTCTPTPISSESSSGTSPSTCSPGSSGSPTTTTGSSMSRSVHLRSPIASTAAVVAIFYVSWRLIRGLGLPGGPGAILLTVFGSPLFYYAIFQPGLKHAFDALLVSVLALLLLQLDDSTADHARGRSHRPRAGAADLRPLREHRVARRRDLHLLPPASRSPRRTWRLSRRRSERPRSSRSRSSWGFRTAFLPSEHSRRGAGRRGRSRSVTSRSGCRGPDVQPVAATSGVDDVS